jgi:arylsulfatase A-like enzyme
VCGHLVHQADLIATLADILGRKLPDNAGEDSFSLLPLLKGGDKPVREHAVSCASSGVPGLRRGPWKLILERDPKANTEVQLYNLDDDIGEKTNLAAEKPELVAEMRALMDRLVADGRSTPGAKQRNDVEVRRHPVTKAAQKKATLKQERK